MSTRLDLKKMLFVATIILSLIPVNVWSSTYTATHIQGLSSSTPTAGAFPPSEAGPAIREIKTTLKNAFNTTTVVDTYTALVTDDVIVCNKATLFTVTLPAAATAGDGKKYEFININAGTVTIAGSGAETIDGAANISIIQNMRVFIVCNGTAWYTLGVQSSVETTGFKIAGGGTKKTLTVSEDSTLTTELHVTAPATHIADGATGFTIAGGTTSKTLTITNNATINQSVDTTANPTFAAPIVTSIKASGAEQVKIWTYTHTVTAAEKAANLSTVTVTAVTLAKIRALHVGVLDISQTYYYGGMYPVANWLKTSRLIVTAEGQVVQVELGVNVGENDVITVTIIEAA